MRQKGDSRVIDPVGLLSAAWIHSRASSPRHTAVARHKEGSISTAPRCLLPPPACAFKVTPSIAEGETTGRERSYTREDELNGDGEGKGCYKQGDERSSEVSPQIKPQWRQPQPHVNAAAASAAERT
ncbi:uncharacterized protein V6R79_016036 [Siganus canaliculatus]